MTEASTLQKDVCKAGALLPRWPLSEGRGVGWVHLSCFFGSSHPLALLPDTTLIQLPGTLGLFCYTWGTGCRCTPPAAQSRLDKIPNSAFLPLPSSTLPVVVVIWQPCSEVSCNYLHNLSQNSLI